MIVFAEDTKNTGYYAAYDDNAIYGVGTSPEAAIDDALSHSGYQSMEDMASDGHGGFRVLPIDPAYAKELLRDGYNREAFLTEGGVITKSK